MWERETARRIWGGSKPDRYLPFRCLAQCEEIDAKAVLQIGAGRGRLLEYIAQSRDGAYAGISTRQDWVHEESAKFLAKNLHKTVRLFAADPTDPKTYRSFPNQDLIVAFDLPASAASKIIETASASLRVGGRLVLGAWEHSGQGSEGLAEVLSNGYELLERSEALDTAGPISIQLARFILGTLRVSATATQELEELRRAKEQSLEYRLSVWART